MLLGKFRYRKKILNKCAALSRTTILNSSGYFVNYIFAFYIPLESTLMKNRPVGGGWDYSTRYMVMPLISLGKKSVDFWGMTSPDVAIFITWSTSQGFSKNEICARPLSTASSAASASRSYVKLASAVTACGVMP